MNALGGEDRERWMRAIADKVQQLKDALVVLPKRQGTRYEHARRDDVALKGFPLRRCYHVFM